MQLNAKLRELLPLVGVLSPAATNNVERFSNVVDMGAHIQAVAVVALGDMAAETIDAKLYACDSDGNNAVALTANSAAQLAAHASNNDNKQIVLNVRSDDLLASGKRYLKLGVVTGGATGGSVAAVILAQTRSGNAATVDLSSVLQLVG
jgi:hypothetical protein